MGETGIGKFRIGVFFDSFKFEFTPYSDCYILQFGFLQIGWLRRKCC